MNVGASGVLQAATMYLGGVARHHLKLAVMLDRTKYPSLKL